MMKKSQLCVWVLLFQLAQVGSAVVVVGGGAEAVVGGGAEAVVGGGAEAVVGGGAEAVVAVTAVVYQLIVMNLIQVFCCLHC